MKTPCFTLNYAAPEVLKQAFSCSYSSSAKLTSSSSLSFYNNSNGDGYNKSCDLWSLGVILYTILCGKAPFQSNSRETNAAVIMTRIKEGEFSYTAPQWELVSDEAKNLITGLLTVDPNERLTMKNLIKHPWVVGHTGYSTAPLATPVILNNPNVTEDQVNVTFKAFDLARKDGFRLMDVSAAPLAQRRKSKKSSAEMRSSCGSTGSYASILTPGTLDSHRSTSESSSNSQSNRHCSDSENSVFNFCESKVNAYLSDLPSINENPIDCKCAYPYTSCTLSFFHLITHTHTICFHLQTTPKLYQTHCASAIVKIAV